MRARESEEIEGRKGGGLGEGREWVAGSRAPRPEVQVRDLSTGSDPGWEVERRHRLSVSDFSWFREMHKGDDGADSGEFGATGLPRGEEKARSAVTG